jgi:hypothetical protein
MEIGNSHLNLVNPLMLIGSLPHMKYLNSILVIFPPFELCLSSRQYIFSTTYSFS